MLEHRPRPAEATILALVGQFLIIVAQHLTEMGNDDFRAPIFGVGREVAINRGIQSFPRS